MWCSDDLLSLMPAFVKVIISVSYLFGPSVVTAGLARKVALLKRHCFASVFEYMFDKQAAGGSKDKAIIHYRDDETM